MGNRIDKHGVPYSLTEEFVEVYRLHSLLPEALALRRHQDGSPIEQVPLPMTRHGGIRRPHRAGEHDRPPLLLR